MGTKREYERHADSRRLVEREEQLPHRSSSFRTQLIVGDEVAGVEDPEIGPQPIHQAQEMAQLEQPDFKHLQALD